MNETGEVLSKKGLDLFLFTRPSGRRRGSGRVVVDRGSRGPGVVTPIPVLEGFGHSRAGPQDKTRRCDSVETHRTTDVYGEAFD